MRASGILVAMRKARHNERRGEIKPFEQFETLTKRLVSVPKKEIDERAVAHARKRKRAKPSP